MNNNFDLTVKKALIDAKNWHTLGQLQEGQQFEIDNTIQDTWMTYIAGMTLGVGAFQGKPQEWLERGSVRLSGYWGGIARTVNRTMYGTISTFENSMTWLNRFIGMSIVDLNVLKTEIQRPLPLDLAANEKKKILSDKMELLTSMDNLRKEIASSTHLVNRMKASYVQSPETTQLLNELHVRINNQAHGLIRHAETAYLEALSHIPSEAFIQPGADFEGFATINRFHTSDVRIFPNRHAVIKGWKDRLKTPIELMEFKESEPHFVAPMPLVLDLHRTYAFKIDGESYISRDHSNAQKRYKEYYDTLCARLGAVGAERLFMLLNQNIFADCIKLLMLVGYNGANKNFIYDVGLDEPGVLTLKLDLTLRRAELVKDKDGDICGLKEWQDSFYKVEAMFLTEELNAPDFYEKEDPLPSLTVIEVVDVNGFKEEQLNIIESQR